MTVPLIELGPNQAINVVLDTRDMCARFIAAYIASEISTVAALVILPVRSCGEGVTIQFAPATKEPNALILKLINASFSDGQLAEFGKNCQVTAQTRLFEIADGIRFGFPRLSVLAYIPMPHIEA